MTEARLINIKTLLCALVAIVAPILSVGVAPVLAAEQPGPHWDIITRTAPTKLPPNGKGAIIAVIINLGDKAVVGTPSNPVKITDVLPDVPLGGLVATRAMEGYAMPGHNRTSGDEILTSCEALPVLRCSYVGVLPPYIGIEVEIPVKTTEEGLLGENRIEVEGGEAPPKTVSGPITASAGEVPFGVELYESNFEEEDGEPDYQAGSHPFQFTSTVEFNQTFGPDPEVTGVGGGKEDYPTTPALLRNLDLKLPPGFVGNTTLIPQCSEVDFTTLVPGNYNLCPPQSAVGVAVVSFHEPIWYAQQTSAVPVFNLAPAFGQPARFGFEFERVPVTFNASVLTGETYAVEVKSTDTTQVADVLSADVTIWGEPGDPLHDNARGWECLGGGHYGEGSEERGPCRTAAQLGISQLPYLTLPTTCQPLSTSVEVESWKPGASFLAPVEPPRKTSLEGCAKLPFKPSIEVQPSEHAASTPTGLRVNITFPQKEGLLAPGGLAEGDLKDSTLKLPGGMQANPGAADGLQTCTAVEGAGFNGFEHGLEEAAQLENDHFSPEAASCPEASKIGTVRIKTPLLQHELTGSVYFAEQDTNPFASPLVLYLVVEDPVSGVHIKLAGEVQISEQTGQLVSVFRNTPALPFEELELELFNGPRATQTTPPACGTPEAETEFTPWSGTKAAPGTVSTPSAFDITSGPNGSPCPPGPQPFAPSFKAYSASSQAGGFTSFTLTIARPDGEQALKAISLHLPPGLEAMLASVTPCPEPQASDGTCGPESLIGRSSTLSGLGGDPYELEGSVYLTGPYDGAPFGLSTVTPAIAGPFHIGDVVVRSSININQYTAAATINTEAAKLIAFKHEEGEASEFAGLPELIKGVPAQIKELNVTIERPGFQFNPTSCEPMSITGTLAGWQGASETVSSPFQATNCGSLAFHPNFTASTSGQTSKTDGASLDVKITYPHGASSNIAKSVTDLPYALPTRLTTIQKACPDTVFDTSPSDCDEGSIIGEGIVHTPVLKSELRGPAYLVSHGARAFPDIEIVLQGEGVTLVLDGETDIKQGITKTTFNSVPDAPAESFELLLPEGPHSALAANENLCDPTKTVTERVAVTSRVHGHTVHSSKTITKTVPEELVIPTTLTAQNGLTLTQNTPITVTGCGAVKSFKAKAPTRAQKLAKALRNCHKKSKAVRATCEAQARKHYGPLKSSRT